MYFNTLKEVGVKHKTI